MSIDSREPAVRDDLWELRTALAGLVFPAGHDEVLATLVRHAAPLHLVRRVGVLPRDRCFHSLDDLCTELDEAPVPRSRPPWA